MWIVGGGGGRAVATTTTCGYNNKKQHSNVSSFCFRFLHMRVFHVHPTDPSKNIRIHRSLAYSMFVHMVCLQLSVHIKYIHTPLKHPLYKVHCCFQVHVLVSYWLFFICVEPIIKAHGTPRRTWHFSLIHLFTSE